MKGAAKSGGIETAHETCGGIETAEELMSRRGAIGPAHLRSSAPRSLGGDDSMI